MVRRIEVNRNAFVTALGAAGVGIVATGGRTPVALARQDEDADQGVNESKQPFEEALAHRKEMYAEFTTALAQELGVSDGDEVDAAIRKAMMTVIDAQVGNDFLTYGQAEALKTLVATSDVPIAPGFIHAPITGGFIHHRLEGSGPGFPDHVFIRSGDKGLPFLDRIKEQCTDATAGGD
jgi:hypothetical protein